MTDIEKMMILLQKLAEKHPTNKGLLLLQESLTTISTIKEYLESIGKEDNSSKTKIAVCIFLIETLIGDYKEELLIRKKV